MIFRMWESGWMLLGAFNRTGGKILIIYGETMNEKNRDR